MRVKKVNRYWCDFCNKATLAAGAMRKHEAHCTMNPARNCRVCGLMGGGVTVGAERMAELVAMLPDPTPYFQTSGAVCQCRECSWPHDEWKEGPCTSESARWESDLAAAMKRLREEASNCPACILAALRQRKIPVPMVESFNFKTEMRAVLDEWSANNFDDRGY